MISLFALQRDQTKLRIMNFIMVLQRHLENILLSWKEFFEKLKFNETSNAKNYIKWKCFLCRIYFLVIFCEMILLCGLSQQFHIIFVTFSAWPPPLRKCVTMHFIFLHLTSLTSYILHLTLLLANWRPRSSDCSHFGWRRTRRRAVPGCGGRGTG